MRAPSSCNVAFNEVLTDSGALKSGEDLNAIFTGAGIDLSGYTHPRSGGRRPLCYA